MMSLPLGQVFEAMMERRQDQILDYKKYICFFFTVNVNKILVFIWTLLCVIWEITENTYYFDNNYIYMMIFKIEKMLKKKQKKKKNNNFD